MVKKFSELKNTDELQNILNKTNGVTVLKFGATWCGPCKKIAPVVYKHIETLNDDVSFYDIDIDDFLDVYAYFKNKKMANGIPTMLAWYKENKTLVPSLICIGAKDQDITFFLSKITNP